MGTLISRRSFLLAAGAGSRSLLPTIVLWGVVLQQVTDQLIQKWEQQTLTPERHASYVSFAGEEERAQVRSARAFSLPLSWQKIRGKRVTDEQDH